MNAHPNLSVETATQLAVFLANRPGALARVCEALANAGVNIHALATSDTVDHTIVRMVVSDPTKALMLLGEGRSGGSWMNLDCCAVRCNPPKFLDLFVGNCDATGSPVVPAMKRANPAASVLNSVNHNVGTRRNSVCSRTLVVFI
jgi:hypothetical protein